MEGHSLRGSVDWNYFSAFCLDNSCMSLPSWECWLKYFISFAYAVLFYVTPFVGVLIEIAESLSGLLRTSCHSLRGSVDWNSKSPVSLLSSSTSLPSWECWLKYNGDDFSKNLFLVTPFVGVLIEILQDLKEVRQNEVTPFVGVLIEIKKHRLHNYTKKVTPFVGVLIEIDYSTIIENQKNVTPFVGVLIEIRMLLLHKFWYRVTPFVGVLIEIC